MDTAPGWVVISRAELKRLQRDVAATGRLGFLAGVVCALAVGALVQWLAR